MSIHLWPQGMYPWIVLNITWKCLFKVLSTDRLLKVSSNDKKVQYPTCQWVSKGGICWFLYKQTDMEISSISFNLLNSGSKEGKLKEMIFFRRHPRTIRVGRSSHTYEYTEKVKIINLISTTDVWQLIMSRCSSV